MSTLKPLNDQPVELTLSFESVLKIETALKVVIAQAAKCRNMYKDNIASGLDADNVYVNEALLQTMYSEITYLTDLRRVLTNMLDSVADKYADDVLQQDKEMQAAIRPSPAAEKTVDSIVAEVNRLRSDELPDPSVSWIPN